MVGMYGTTGPSAYQAQSTRNEVKNSADSTANVTEEQTVAGTRKVNYGKTIGEPKLSDKAQKYYEELKKKYGNYDFILVSSDEMENAKANAAKYANGFKTVVLIDEEKIEKMAADEKFRKKYEGILNNASVQLQQLKSSMEKTGANVKGYGIQVNDNGTTSLFAVLKKSSADQKARIERKAEQRRAERKAADKKAAKKEQEERLKNTGKEGNNRIDSWDDEDTVVISADSVEDLIKKVEDYTFIERSNSIQTEGERKVGQHIDFKG